MTCVPPSSGMKSELLKEIRKVDQKIDSLNEKIDRVETNLTNRIDKLGLQIAKLEDDTPTKEEFDGLEDRVASLDQTAAPASN